MSSPPEAPDNQPEPLIRESAVDLARMQTFSVLWAQCQPSVRAYLASFLSDDMQLDDCVQEVALVAWNKGPLQEGDSAFLGYTLATARLIGLATIRKKQSNRLHVFSPDVALALADTVAEQEFAEPNSTSQRVTALRICLDKLDPEPRALVEARYFQNGHERLKEEAQRLGKSLDALYKKLERLRDLLRNCISSQLGTTE